MRSGPVSSERGCRYTRNLVDSGNDRFNLMIVCWGEGHGSSVHDHSDAHCFVKVLDGQLKETMFDWPCTSSLFTQSQNDNTDGYISSAVLPDHEPLTETAVNYYDKDGVTYINGLQQLIFSSSLFRVIILYIERSSFSTMGCIYRLTSHKIVSWYLGFPIA